MHIHIVHTTIVLLYLNVQGSRFLTLEDGSDRLSRNGGKELTATHWVVTQKSRILIYFVAEAWHHTCTWIFPLSFSSLWELLLFNLKIILEFCHHLSLYDELLPCILSFYCQCETQYELHLWLVFDNSVGLCCIKYCLFAYVCDITFYLPALFI